MLRFVLLLLPLLVGCHYKSDYRPPADGRARAVWQGDKLVMYAPDGDPPVCRDGQLDRAPDASGGSYWDPVEYDGRLEGHRRSGGSVTVVVPIINVHGGVSHSHSSSGGSASNSAEGNLQAFAALAVAALAVLPIATVALALSRPEDEQDVADEIDRVNRYNDEVRHAWRRCGYEGSGAAK
jgi:hypothetical protein